MRNLIFAIAAVLAFSFTTSTAMARHWGYRPVVHHYAPVVRVVTPHHHVYRPTPVYVAPYHGHYVPTYHHHYHYARPGVIGVYGGNYSLYLGY